MAWTIALKDNGIGFQYQARVDHDPGVVKASDLTDGSADRKTYTCKYLTANGAAGGTDYFWPPMVNRNDPTGRLVDPIVTLDGKEKGRVEPKPTVRDSC